MPQAIERLLATPMTSPCLPCIRVPAGVPLSAPGALIWLFPYRLLRAEADAVVLSATYTPYAAAVHPAPGADQNCPPPPRVGRPIADRARCPRLWQDRRGMADRTSGIVVAGAGSI